MKSLEKSTKLLKSFFHMKKIAVNYKLKKYTIIFTFHFTILTAIIQHDIGPSEKFKKRKVLIHRLL